MANPSNDEDANRVSEINRLFDEFSPKFPDAPEITAETLLSQSIDGTYMYNSKPVVVVDVRTDLETEVSVIKNAMTKVAFEKKLQTDSGAFENKIIVAYCTIGYRSAQFVEKLRSKEKKQLEAYNLKGSILAWTHAGGGLEETKTKNKTKKVHVFGKSWDLAASDCESVYFTTPALSYVGGFIPDALKPWRWFKK